MKRFTLSILLAFSIGNVANAQQAIYEFPNTSCPNGLSNGIDNCFSPCSACIAPDTAGMGEDAFRLFGMTFAFNGVEVCRASNSPYDSYLSTSFWEVDTVSEKWLSTDAVVNGYETGLDSTVVVCRSNGPNHLCLDVSVFGSSIHYTLIQTIPTDGVWTNVVFDLSNTLCTQFGVTIIGIQLRAFGNYNGNLDIDAIRNYGHDCSISTDARPSSEINDPIIVAMETGIQLTSSFPTDVNIYDMSGKTMFQHSNWSGMSIIQFESGIYIVRVGNVVKKVILY